MPPAYSAKKVNGERAYKLARAGDEVELEKVETTIYSISNIVYAHPFLSFEISVSKGGYIRSIAEIVASRLGTAGALSYLERVSEGRFQFENEKALNPLEYIDYEFNVYTGSAEDIYLGRRIGKRYLAIGRDGRYILRFNDFFSIIEISGGKVDYLVNRIPRSGG
jgi:tRNA pseudouridine55 synthase